MYWTYGKNQEGFDFKKQRSFVRQWSQFTLSIIKFAKLYKRKDKFKDRLVNVTLHS